MAYDPTVWKSGDTITSAKLNKLENGLAEASGGGTGGGVLVVNDNNGTLDKTWQEIVNTGFAIILNGSLPFVGTQIYALANFKADEEESEYSVSFINIFNTSAENETYIATSADGYPEADK